MFRFSTTRESAVACMYPWLILLLAALHAPFVFGQTERPAFHVLMEMARVKKVIAVDTVAGKTNVLLTSNTDEPAFVFVFAPGGDGTLAIEAGANGIPHTKRVRNPAYYFAPGFLEKQAAWAAIDVPESYGIAVSRQQRLEERHIDAMTRVARRLREDYPKAKHILIGHSNGGITAGMLAMQDNPVYDGFVFSAPNLSAFPANWDSRQAKAPIMFITHQNDDCGIQYKRLPISTLTIRAAGKDFPLSVIKTPSPGNHQECFAAPAPHFFTHVFDEYTDAIMKWAMSLK
jgi:pimeloyl-ACP methyl ester carboxylesterase